MDHRPGGPRPWIAHPLHPSRPSRRTTSMERPVNRTRPIQLSGMRGAAGHQHQAGMVRDLKAEWLLLAADGPEIIPASASRPSDSGAAEPGEVSLRRFSARQFQPRAVGPAANNVRGVSAGAALGRARSGVRPAWRTRCARRGGSGEVPDELLPRWRCLADPEDARVHWRYALIGSAAQTFRWCAAGASVSP